jgi:hypothetical protein
VAALGAAAPAPLRANTGTRGTKGGAGGGAGAGAGAGGKPVGGGAAPSPRIASPRTTSPRMASPRIASPRVPQPGRANGAGGYAAPSKPPVSRGGVSTASSVLSDRPGRRVKIVTPGSTRVVRGSIDHGTGRGLGFGA